jgi:hypothetical protein
MLKELEIMQLWSAGKRRTGGPELRRVRESTPKCGGCWPCLLAAVSAHFRVYPEALRINGGSGRAGYVLVDLLYCVC